MRWRAFSRKENYEPFFQENEGVELSLGAIFSLLPNVAKCREEGRRRCIKKASVPAIYATQALQRHSYRW